MTNVGSYLERFALLVHQALAGRIGLCREAAAG
jgi:hypothetical protein